jgi:hypothetical protein
MHRSLLFCLAAFTVAPHVRASSLEPVAPLAPAFVQDRASPFDGLRWNERMPEVLLEETWYRPLFIDDVAVEDVLEFCAERWPGKREKRFGEDLVEALMLMGHEPRSTVTLVLERVDDGSEVTLEGVVMTEAKRNAIRDGGNKRERPRPPERVSPDQARTDIAAFRAGLEGQFAYLQLRGVDLVRELERVEERLEDDVAVADLAADLNEVLMQFGDGHARLRSAYDPRPARFLPFRLETAGGGVVAYGPDGGLLDPVRPFVHALDGRPLEAWVDALRPTIPAGSPQYVLQRALRFLSSPDIARVQLELPDSPRVRVTLGRGPADDGSTRGGANGDGGVGDLELPLGRKPVGRGASPERASRVLRGEEAHGIDGGVGYLRLAQMDDDLIPALHQWMGEFRNTGGLVVDVRGNGGGLRGLLMALAGYLLAEDAPPVIGNVAAYRLHPRFRRDHLGGSRHLYRAGDEHWTERQQTAIEAFAPTFRPEWKLPEGFSEWHYLLLDRTGHPDEYAYTKPVAILCDAGCFSATDIFLGALECLPQVTLVGRASGGGSARSQGFSLPNTGIDVRCASMASFRPNGLLYDGRGVEVDVEVDRAPGDLVPGGGDTQLEAALESLRH